MKILEFKTVSPLFEMERDGAKPFTIRKVEYNDMRHRALSQWNPEYKWAIKIINPATGDNFVREIAAVSYLRYFDLREADYWKRFGMLTDWRIILLGELLAEDK